MHVDAVTSMHVAILFLKFMLMHRVSGFVLFGNALLFSILRRVWIQFYLVTFINTILMRSMPSQILLRLMHFPDQLINELARKRMSTLLLLRLLKSRRLSS